MRCEKHVRTATCSGAAGLVVHFEFVAACEEDADEAYLAYPGATIWDEPFPPYQTAFRNCEMCFKLGFSENGGPPRKLVALRHFDFRGAPAIERLSWYDGPLGAASIGAAEDPASWQRSATLSHVAEFVDCLSAFAVPEASAPAILYPGADFVVSLALTLARAFPSRPRRAPRLLR